ncbi:sulfotransferase family 2 domain-containing protein [Henriciella litoralis]|uniref:sulfotransferase family 2 domain-containing protein n=1 Tax=Henriciella litoralis TaxID=568102 RepID=UPI0009FFDA29|nr:sulfotransferase family 2 domain-containing protein [Henriciella litoralis]
MFEQQKLKFGFWRKSADSFRTPLYHADFPVVVMWSQKAACTVAVKWFFHHIGLLEEALSHHRWIHNYENEVFKARAGYLKECRRAISSGKPVVKLVRNPYARAYSGYLETCNRRVLTDKKHWSSHARAEILEKLTGQPQDMELAYSFLQYCDWLGGQPESGLDPHIAPQHERVENNLEVRTLKIDGATDVFLEIETEYGLPSTENNMSIHHSSHHHKRKNITDEEATGLLTLGMPLKRERDFQVPDISPHIIAASPAGATLRHVYRRDFQAYGYEI